MARAFKFTGMAGIINSNPNTASHQFSGNARRAIKSTVIARPHQFQPEYGQASISRQWPGPINFDPNTDSHQIHGNGRAHQSQPEYSQPSFMAQQEITKAAGSPLQGPLVAVRGTHQITRYALWSRPRPRVRKPSQKALAMVPKQPTRAQQAAQRNAVSENALLARAGTKAADGESSTKRSKTAATKAANAKVTKKQPAKRNTIQVEEGPAWTGRYIEEDNQAGGEGGGKGRVERGMGGAAKRRAQGRGSAGARAEERGEESGCKGGWSAGCKAGCGRSAGAKAGGVRAQGRVERGRKGGEGVRAGAMGMRKGGAGGKYPARRPRVKGASGAQGGPGTSTSAASCRSRAVPRLMGAGPPVKREPNWGQSPDQLVIHQNPIYD
ncbi:hypothetical protein B0H11DRAFT_1902982 [Mycena galericulata]|nr:hypothetical protein B0H11DRAFT_1902982 [Mycena galericulata]